tara:strand:+ start:515 stop:886 length:372 start_codon:yes stop_codon:yes gene_type:complete
MKKLIFILIIYFSSHSIAYALCNDYEKIKLKDNPHYCSLQDFEKFIQKLKDFEKIKKRNKYAKYLPNPLPKNVSYKEAVKLIKLRKKENKFYDEYECSRISASANNSWSANKIYRSCMKKKGY